MGIRRCMKRANQNLGSLRLQRDSRSASRAFSSDQAHAAERARPSTPPPLHKIANLHYLRGSRIKPFLRERLPIYARQDHARPRQQHPRIITNRGANPHYGSGPRTSVEKSAEAKANRSPRGSADSKCEPLKAIPGTPRKLKERDVRDAVHVRHARHASDGSDCGSRIHTSIVKTGHEC
jgi:hypothetical protein